MSTLEEKIAVMQAALNGRAIEFTPRRGQLDWACVAMPIWDWNVYEYRVKKEKKYVERYAIVYTDGTVGDIFKTREKAAQHSLGTSAAIVKLTGEYEV